MIQQLISEHPLFYDPELVIARCLEANTMILRRLIPLYIAALLCASTFRVSAQTLDWSETKQGDFVFAIAQGGDGFWAGTENRGVWRRDATGWRNFTRADGLGDDTALCLARRGGQMWVGHARSGLSVWDGAKWTNLSVEDGLPSERVGALSVGGDGAVWVGTENGLLRWSDAEGWFVPDSALCQRAIAGVASAGDLVVAATSCEGLIVSRDGGKSWEEVRGPQLQPNTPSGAGLPSDVLNDVKIDALGQIWVASDTGFARSDDGGKTWFYVRGNDWKANVEGSAAGLKAQNAAVAVDLAGEDWVQTLAPTGDGKIWLGFRQKGAELRDCKSGEVIFVSTDDRSASRAPSGDWVRSILPLRGDRALVAQYSGGIVGLLKATIPPPLEEHEAAAFKVPTPFSTWDAARLNLLADAKTALNRSLAPGSAAWEGYDFRTQGDWVGRYGDQVAMVYNPHSEIYPRAQNAGFEVKIGPHLAPGGTGPYIYGGAAGYGERSALYFPAQGERRRAEINDGTFDHLAYPFSWEGPDLWAEARVPAGAHRLSFYFANGDGNRGDLNRYRDYIVSLRAFQPDLKIADRSPDLVRSRIRDAATGTYARFCVVGPAKFWVKVARHRSFVTKINGLFLDRIAVAPADENKTTQNLQKAAMPWMAGVRYVTEPVPPAQIGETEIVTAARRAWDALDEAALREGGIQGRWQNRLQIYRAAKAAGAPDNLLFNWEWKLALWRQTDRDTFDATMQEAWAKESARREAQARKPRTPAESDAIKANFDAIMAAEKADAAKAAAEKAAPNAAP